MNRSRIIFLILSVYIVAAFSWWTYAHCYSAYTIYQLEKENLETSCYKATLDVSNARDEGLFEDTVGLKTFFTPNYPELEIIFFTETDPLQNFMIRPCYQSYYKLENGYHRKLWMFVLEGTVMLGLIFWGLGWIYLSFRRDLNLKKQQRNFLLSVTHELKTPLTGIQLYLQTLMKRKLPEDQTKTILQNTLDDTKRLSDLVENLLLAAQLENSKYALNLEPFCLSEILPIWVSKFAEPRNIANRLQTMIEFDVWINADKNAVEMMVNNLLSNALKYSPVNGNILIKVKTEDGVVSLSVADEGIGISEEDKKELFKKFFRIEDENTRKTKGTGLGLFIVKNLATLHKAAVLVKDGEPKGTIFEIQFKHHGR